MVLSKSNRLIAEYMGFDYSQADVISVQLKYNTSWEWLMEVVEKIRSEGYIFEMGNRLTIHFKQRYFTDVRGTISDDSFVLTSFSDKDLKQLTYDTVVNYLVWHNAKLLKTN